MSCLKKGNKALNLLRPATGNGGKNILGSVKEYVEDSEIRTLSK